MTQRQLHTIVLQEEKIAALAKRNAALESGYRSVCKVNERLRKQIRILQGKENALNDVNV